MKIKYIYMVIVIIVLACVTNLYAEDHKMHHDLISKDDARISLGLSGKMKQHQLSNMRGHVEAVQQIISLVSRKKFDEASNIAHSKLGLTKEMEKMCNMFKNENFKTIGFAFHRSGDELGNILKTKNLENSLNALNKTLGYCVRCHKQFRQ